MGKSPAELRAYVDGKDQVTGRAVLVYLSEIRFGDDRQRDILAAIRQDGEVSE